MAKRRGRPPLSVETHLQRGTYRPDRHGPLPMRIVSSTPLQLPGPTVGAEATDDQAIGAAFTAALLRAWSIDDPVGLQDAKSAGEALDRRDAIDALLNGPTGLLAKAAAGAVSASHLDALLKARKQASEQFAEALDRLDLDAAPAANPSMRGAR
jgi:hypothetical protein